MLPRGKPFPIALRTWIAATALGLNAAATPNVQSHDASPPKGKPYPQYLRTFSQSTPIALYASAKPQVQSHDAATPRGKMYPLVLRTHVQSTPVAPYAAATPNVAVFDAMPPKGKAYPTIHRTWVCAVNLELLGKDQFFGAAGEPPTYNWPNPRVKPAVQPASFFARDLSLLSQPVSTHSLLLRRRRSANFQ